jgi:hypothetical protein
MRPLIAARARIALGLVTAVILTVPAALHLHHHRADAPDIPAAAGQHAAPPGDSARAAPDLAGLQIQAQHPDLGQALPRALTGADLAGDVRLVFAESGAVAGSALGDGPVDSHIIHVAADRDGRDYVSASFAGAFSIPQLPAGDDTASLDAEGAEIAAPPVAFHVAASQTTRVEIPPAPARATPGAP